LFLDEPTVDMDIEARQKLSAAIRQLLAEGCSVLLTGSRGIGWRARRAGCRRPRYPWRKRWPAAA